MNKEIAVYDNTVSARMYLSYISEQAGGFAFIGRDGKLYIKTFKYALGKKIGEGKSIIIKEKNNLKAKVIINGNHKQETTKGYNILACIPTLKSNIGGLINILNDDGSITTVGIPSYNYVPITEEINITEQLKDGVTYTIKQEVHSKIYTQVKAKKSDGSITYINTYNSNKVIFTVDKSTYISYTTAILSTSMSNWGNASETITNKYILYEGTDDKPFEKYTGGISSPNPDYPPKIETVGDNINLFNKDVEVKDAYPYIAVGSTITYVSSSATKTYVKCCYLKQGTYYISYKNGTIDRTSDRIGVIVDDDDIILQSVITWKNLKDSIIITTQYDGWLTLATEKNVYDIQVKKEESIYSPYNQGSVEIIKQNKNLFDKNKALLGYELNGNTGGVLKNDLVFISDYIKVKPSCQYFLSGKKNGTSNCFYDKNKNYISRVILENGLLTVPNDPNIYYLRFNARLETLDTTMLERNTIKTAYESHQEENYIMPIQREMLEGDFIDDVEHHEWGKYIFTGEETILVGKVEDITFFNISVSDLSDFNYIDDKTLNYMCTHFKAIKVVDRYQNNTFFINIGKKAIFCSKEITTIDDFKAWLKERYDSGNPVIIYYQLKTPIELELTDEQKKVLKEIHNMDLYEDYTIIESEAEMQVNFARAEISIKLFQNFEWGAKYNFSKIRYEDGIRVFEKGDDTGNTLYINPDNMFIVDQEQIDNIYDELKDLELYSFKGDSIVDPALDIGDIVLIDGKQVLYCGSSQYSGRWKASISSEIKSKERQETTTVKKPSQKTINRRVQSSIEQIDGKIEQLVEENSEMSEKLSKHEQDINSIKDTVESMEDFTRETSSYQELHLVDTAEYAENLILTLKIYGDTEKWKELVPSTLLAPGLTVAPLGTTIDLIVDSQSRLNPSENKQVFKIRYGKKLRSLGNIRDELDIINNKVSVIRRIGLNDSGQEYVLEEEQTEELGELKLPTLKADTYIYVREYPNLEYFCRYITDNEYIKKFATQEGLQQATVELNTKIEQTNQEIVLLARQKVGKNEVIASINLTPEKAKILAKLIELEGIVTANQNFKILLDGSMEAANGKFTGGKIKLEGGSADNPTFLIGTGSIQSFLTNDGFYANSDTGKAYIYVDDSNGGISILGSLGQAVIRPNKISTTGEMWATAYNYQSQAKLKENIVKFQGEALYMIKKSDIYEFNYKNNSKEKTIGLVIGDGYNTPQEIISNKKGINSYSMVSISWKAIQELDEKIEKIINILKKVPIFGRIFTKRWKNEKNNK